MKEIMISIKPEYVAKILNGQKTIEIRKIKPSCELPCKVYIYCTKGKPYLYRLDDDNNFELINKFKQQEDNFVKDYNDQNCKVIADFTLNRIDKLERDLNDWLPKNRYDISNELLKDMKLNQEQLWEYGQGKTLYAWHIDNLKIYDKPKELSEFKHNVNDYSNGVVMYSLKKEPLKTPPRNYCYVETME